MEKINLVKNTKVYATVIFAALLRALGLQLFLLPNGFTIGGVVGAAFIVQFLSKGFIHFTAAYLVINLPILLTSYFLIGKRFAIKSSVCVVFIGLFVYLLDILNVAELLGSVSINGENLLLYAILAGALNGAAVAVIFSVQASTGGTDILGLLFQKKFRLNSVMRLIMLFDVSVLAIAGIVTQSFDVFMYSFSCVFVSQLAVEAMQKGAQQAVVFEIITLKPQEVAEALFKKLNRGVTKVTAQGMYGGTEKTMLICVIRGRQTALAKSTIKEADPEAFAYVVSVREVVGKGFSNVEI